MKKLLKVFAVLAVLAAVFLGIASVILHVLLPPEKAKAMVLKQLTSHLKREVQVGDVSVGILSGFDIRDLKISESPDFSKGTFLSSDHFSLKLSLIPLIFRRVVINHIDLVHPEVTIIRYADGKTYNFSDLVSSAAAQPAASVDAGPSLIPMAYAAGPAGSESTAGAPPFALVVSRADLEKGVIHFIDRSAARQSMDINPLNMRLRNASTTGPFSIQTSLQAQAKGAQVELRLAGTANLAAGSFKIKTCTLSSAGSTLSLAGQATQLKSVHPSADLKLDIKQFSMAALAPFISLPPALHVSGPVGGHATVKGDEKKMDIAALLDFAKAKILYGKQFLKPENVPMSVSFQGAVKNFQNADIAGLEAVLGKAKLVGHGTLQGLASQQPSVALHLDTNEFSIEELLRYVQVGLSKDLKVQGNTRLSADVSGTQASSRIAAKWDGKNLAITMGNQFAKTPGIPLDFSLIGEALQAQTFNFQTLAGNIGPIQLQGSGSYKMVGAGQLTLALKTNTWSLQAFSKLSPMLAAYHPTGNAALDLQASGSPSAPAANGSFTLQDASGHAPEGEFNHVAANILFAVPAGATMPSKTSGHLPAGSLKQEYYQGQNLEAKWNLTDITPDLSRISGTANLKQGPGKIIDVEKLAAMSKTAHALLAPIETLEKLQSKGVLKGIGIPALKTIPFDALRGDDVFQAGTLNIKVFDLTGKDLDVHTQGTIGMAGVQPINLKVVMKLAPGAIGGTVGQLVQDENGRPTFKFAATGSVADAHVKLDVQEATHKAVQQLGGQLLKNIFGGQQGQSSQPAEPSNAAPGTAAPPSNTQSNPVDDLQKKLKGIFH